jgi:oxygen-independent coproporphyrinogen-3 oxidase
LNPEAANLIAGFIADGMIEPREALHGQLKLTLKGRLLADALVRALVG